MGRRLDRVDGGGADVILSIQQPELPADISLASARLTLAGTALGEAQNLRLHVLALSAPWNGGIDAPVIDGAVGRLEVAAGGLVQGVDVANILRDVLVAPEFEGLLVTPAESAEVGFNESDAQAILAAFQGATLQLSYRPIPPAPSPEDGLGSAFAGSDDRSRR